MNKIEDILKLIGADYNDSIGKISSDPISYWYLDNGKVHYLFILQPFLNQYFIEKVTENKNDKMSFESYNFNDYNLLEYIKTEFKDIIRGCKINNILY